MPAKGVAIVSARAELVVVGGGVVGLAIAWQAAQAGTNVTVVDPAAGEAASWVAAGMLAPASESWFGEEALLRLNLLAGWIRSVLSRTSPHCNARASCGRSPA